MSLRPRDYSPLVSSMLGNSWGERQGRWGSEYGRPGSAGVPGEDHGAPPFNLPGIWPTPWLCRKYSQTCGRKLPGGSSNGYSRWCLTFISLRDLLRSTWYTSLSLSGSCAPQPHQIAESIALSQSRPHQATQLVAAQVPIRSLAAVWLVHSHCVKTARLLSVFLFVTHYAECKPEIGMMDKSIHVNLLDWNIMQPAAGSVATIARKCLILVQVICTSVLCLSPFHPVYYQSIFIVSVMHTPAARTGGLFPGVAPHIRFEQARM